MTQVRSQRRVALVCAAVAAAAFAPPASAQTESPFGAFQHDASQPIEITADRLAVDQANQTATFTGEVVAGQGALRLTANEIVVSYGGAGGGDAQAGSIDRLRAEGDVFLSSGTETARGAWADYDVSGGTVTMGGDVVLTQAGNAISGPSLRIDLNAGTGEISGGRVRSVFTPPARDADAD